MHVGRRLPGSIAILLGAISCSGDGGQVTDPLPEEFELSVVEVAGGLQSPVYLTAAPGSDLLYVVELGGRIRIIEGGTVRPEDFLDIRDRVLSGNERGLLSMAFHPDFPDQGHIFVNYTDRAGNTAVERYSATVDQADAASAVRILSVAQPFANHNGGMLQFGPDGMLYIGMGDGGDGGDPLAHGQNANSLLGALLRIDVDGALPYSIPADNPYVSRPDARPEIWATGLRNPWRFSFDRVTGTLYIADVGQSRFEEVNAVPSTSAGLNYGWNRMEASACFPSGASCDRTGLTLPVDEYGRDFGCSITGGYAYRGSELPELHGHYFYGDYCSGRIASFRLENGQAVQKRTWDVGQVGRITSFGQDAGGELYIVVGEGRIFRIAG